MEKRHKLALGDWVEVLSKQEILRTLDAKGRLDGMPFMPEMFEFCGKRFQVYKRAHKTCDPDFKSRRIDNAVHLETRCDGQAHGGCQAGCLIFWKEAWLKPVEGPSSAVPRRLTDLKAADQSAESELAQTTKRTDPATGAVKYRCQATQLPYATASLEWWQISQYFEDYRSGNVGLGAILRGFLYSVYYHLCNARFGLG